MRRRGRWGGIGALVAIAGLAAATAAAQDRVVRFDIPAQPLAAALDAFTRQSGVVARYEPRLAEGIESRPVVGAMTPEAALGRLLDGTGLAYRFVADAEVSIERVAAAPGQSIALPAVTVLGSRRLDVPLSNVPAAVTLIPEAEIRKEQPTATRIEDILARRVPGFNPTNNGVRTIRGRTAQVFVNGVPVNEQLRASSASDLNLITPDQLAGIEVSRGANSAYGFGSPGGIIALQTPRAESEDLTLRTIVRESLNPHRIGGSHQASLYQTVSQIVGRFDYHVGGAIAYDGAEYDPDGELALGFDNSALLTNGKEVLGNIDGSFGLDLADAGRLRLTGTFGHVDFVERYALNRGVYRETFGFLSEEPRGGESFRQSYTLNLAYESEEVLGNALKLEVFTSRVETDTFSTDGGSNFRDEQTNEYYGVRSAVTTPLDVVTDGAAVTYGFDVLRNRYFRPFFDDDTGALVTFFSPDVTLDSYAPYGQLEVPLGDLRVTGGVRHEEYRGHVETAVGSGGITGGDIRSFGLTLFNAGVVYVLNDGLDLYTTFSQGAEITQLGRAAREAASADQVDPRPAKSNQYEIGVRGKSAALRTGLAAFYTESDLLSALECDGVNPCTPLREPREFWGVEGSADWRIDERWGVGGVLTWQDGIRETETGTRRIGSSDVPPVLVSTHVDYRPAAWWRNTLWLDYRAARNPFGDSSEFGEGRVDDVLLVSASAGFEVGPGTLQLGVRNLFNTRYVSIPGEAGNNGFTWIPEQGTRVSTAYLVSW